MSSWKFFATVVVSLASIVGCSSVPSAAKQLVHKKAPHARIFFLDGSESSLEAFEGRNVVLMFWATWCGHSKRAIERFENLAREYHRRKNIEFLAVSLDRSDDLGVLRSRISSQQLRTVTHIFSGNDSYDELYRSFHGETIPYFVVMDPRGVVRVISSSQGDVEGYLEKRVGE